MFSEIFGSNKPRCQHFHEDGKRCAADPQTNNKFCFMHDPEQKEKQAEARRKGGLARSLAYERKLPPNFKYKPLQDEDQVSAFIDEIASYYAEDLIDLRSARFYIYVANNRLAQWNAKDRRQYRAVRSVENQARIMARENDPWSPAHGVLTRAAKAKEEAAKTVGDNHTPQYEVHPKIAAAVKRYPSTMNENEACPGETPWARPGGTQKEDPVPGAMPSDIALSFRELDELQKEEERKEQERAAARKKLSPVSNKENQESESTDSTQASEPAPPKRPPQPVPPAPAGRGASRGSAPAPRPATYNLSEAEIERLRDDICIEAARNAKRSGWKRR